MKLFLVRHGQSVANLDTYYTGQSDVPLTNLGRKQAAQVGVKLANITFDKVYTSDLSRAAETCEIALPNKTAEKTVLLREYDVGSIQGCPYDKLRLVQPDDPQRAPDYTPYGGEDAMMVRARARHFLTSLEDSDYAYVAAFTHQGFIYAMLREIFGTRFRSGTVETDNCSVHVFEYDGNIWKVLAINYMTAF